MSYPGIPPFYITKDEIAPQQCTHYNRKMDTSYLFIHYLSWHYGRGIAELNLFWKNMARFGYDFFSIPLLLKTLISPLYRMHEPLDLRHLRMEAIFETITFNLFARGLGFFMRLVIIAVGVFFEILILFAWPLSFIVWLMLPALSPTLFVMGIVLLII